jgi:hypothetical protein
VEERQDAENDNADGRRGQRRIVSIELEVENVAMPCVGVVRHFVFAHRTCDRSIQGLRGQASPCQRRRVGSKKKEKEHKLEQNAKHFAICRKEWDSEKRNIKTTTSSGPRTVISHQYADSTPLLTPLGFLGFSTTAMPRPALGPSVPTTGPATWGDEPCRYRLASNWHLCSAFVLHASSEQGFAWISRETRDCWNLYMPTLTLHRVATFTSLVFV